MARSAAAVLLIGAYEQGGALAYARESIRRRGHDVLLLDIRPETDTSGDADFAAVDVRAAASGHLGAIPDVEHDALSVLSVGARQIATSLYAQGRIAGVLGIGSADATAVATAAMRALPVGVPKLMLSSVAGDVSAYVDIADITLMHAVVDVDGANAIARLQVRSAAAALCGMVEQIVPVAASRPLIGASMFGVTTPCVTRVRTLLEQAGYDVLVFHANGSGGRALEALIDDGYISAVADITTTEWADEVVGGMRSAGPDRLGAAARQRIPQVVSVGALDIVNFTAPSTVPEAFRDRRLYQHNPNATLVRTTAVECAEIGRRIAERLNMAPASTVLVLPLRGISAIDAPGQVFYDPDADTALFAALRQNCASHVRIVEVDAHINDLEFAERVVAELLALLRGSRRGERI